MKHNLRDKYEYRPKVFKAMGHPTRLFILDELGRQERCVCERTESKSEKKNIAKTMNFL